MSVNVPKSLLAKAVMLAALAMPLKNAIADTRDDISTIPANETTQCVDSSGIDFDCITEGLKAKGFIAEDSTAEASELLHTASDLFQSILETNETLSEPLPEPEKEPTTESGGTASNLYEKILGTD